MTTPPNLEFPLAQRIYTDNDFDIMGWHDCHIYQMRLGEDLEFDIDYILQWNEPELNGLPFTFWISPATLVFKSVRSFSFDLTPGFESEFEIDAIDRDENRWTIITQQGDVQFEAGGYEQFIRQDPSFEFGQGIPYIDRYGYSLERTTEQHNPNRMRDDVVARRAKDLDDFENVQKRHLARKELEALLQAREDRAIDTKQYLQEKRRLDELIFSYDYFLKGTRFEL